MRKLIVHLGYPKTATTTIQRCFFSKHKCINYLGRPFKNEKIGKAMYIISDYDDIVFDENIKFIVDTFDESLTSDKINILSSEHHTHKFTLILGGASERNIGIIAKRLHQIFELINDVDVQFLFTIRNQTEMLESYYIQKHNDFKKTDINTFEKFYKFSINHLDQGFMMTLNYNKIVSFYCNLFGCDRVTVLVFEEFIIDVVSYSNKLSKMLGIDEKEILNLISVKGENLSIQNQNNKKFKYFFDENNNIYTLLRYACKKMNCSSLLPLQLKQHILNFFLKKTEMVKLDKKQEENVKKIFKDSNIKVSNKNNLGLQKFDYF